MITDTPNIDLPLSACSTAFHPSPHLHQSWSAACTAGCIELCVTLASRPCHLIMYHLTSHRTAPCLRTLSLASRRYLAQPAAVPALTPHPANAVVARGHLTSIVCMQFIHGTY
jgi:hypothetical protein